MGGLEYNYTLSGHFIWYTFQLKNGKHVWSVGLWGICTSVCNKVVSDFFFRRLSMDQPQLCNKSTVAQLSTYFDSDQICAIFSVLWYNFHTNVQYVFPIATCSLHFSFTQSFSSYMWNHKSVTFSVLSLSHIGVMNAGIDCTSNCDGSCISWNSFVQKCLNRTKE